MRVTINGAPIRVQCSIFPGGEVHVRLPEIDDDDDFICADDLQAQIVTNITCSDDLMALFLVTDAIRRNYLGIKIHAVIPYMPYARQDRECAPGEALSVKVVADLINLQNYASVNIWDAHSDVAPALLNNCINLHQSDIIWPFIKDHIRLKDTILVSPDAGALKKIYPLAKKWSMPVVRADKTRDVATGKISGTVVYSEHVGDKDFLIVDDICDGGRTFIELAKVLRGLTDGKIYLYVTHGIFSHGRQVFDGLIDKVFVANDLEKKKEQ